MRRGGIAPARRLITRSRLPKTSSLASCSRGSFSQAGKTSGVIPANTAMSSRKSSTSLMWARTMTRVVGACRPSAADTSPAADPQAPSMVAARPFLSAARASGKPEARWICRVKSLNPTAGNVVGVTWAGRAAAVRETLGIEYSLDQESRSGQRGPPYQAR